LLQGCKCTILFLFEKDLTQYFDFLKKTFEHEIFFVR